MTGETILLLRLYPRLMPLFSALVERTGYSFVSDSELSLPRDRLRLVSDVVDWQKISSRATDEVERSVSGLVEMIRDRISEIPGCKESEFQDDAGLERQLRHSLMVYFRYGFMVESLADKCNLKLLVCAPSFLERHRGAISAARMRGIPSLHLQHGLWISPELYHPECADIVTLASEFGLNILDSPKLSNARRIVTGLPFSTPKLEHIPSEEDDRRKQEDARRKLNIDKDVKVVLYSGVFGEGLWLEPTWNFHKRLETFRDLVSVLRDRVGPTKLLVRPSPTQSGKEDAEAFELLADDQGFKALEVTEQDKQLVLDASDVVVTGAIDTSFAFDAFAAGRPVIALDGLPRVSHFESLVKLSEVRPIAWGASELKRSLDTLLDDKKAWLEAQIRGYQFMRSAGSIDPESAIENLCQLIVTIVQGEAKSHA